VVPESRRTGTARSEAVEVVLLPLLVVRPDRATVKEFIVFSPDRGSSCKGMVVRFPVYFSVSMPPKRMDPVEELSSSSQRE